MERNFQIQGSQFQREFTTQYGAMHSYMVGLVDMATGEQINAEVTQKPQTSAPQPGQQVSGTIEQSQYGPKFKRSYQGGGGGGGGGGRGAQQDPAEKAERQARIERQHSQEMALRYFELYFKAKQKLPDSFNGMATIFEYAGHFDKDVRDAGQNARRSAQPQQQGPPQQQPQQNYQQPPPQQQGYQQPPQQQGFAQQPQQPPQNAPQGGGYHDFPAPQQQNAPAGPSNDDDIPF